MFTQEIFCGVCNVKIDEIGSPKKEDLSLAKAMLINDSKFIHYRETGCPASGMWIEGEIKETN